MASLLDELAGVLSPEQIAKINGNPKLAGRFTKVVELEDLYYGDDEAYRAAAPAPAAAAAAAAAAPPTARETPTNDSGIGQMVQGILKRLDKTVTADNIEETVTKVVEKLAPKFVGAAAAQGTRNADELNRIYIGHKSEFGEDFDSTKFDTFIAAQREAGVQYRSVTDAYNAMVGDKRVEARVEKGVNDRVRDELKRRATNHPSGTTPSGTKSVLSVLTARGRKTDEGGATTAEAAGAELETRLARVNAAT